MLLEWKKIISPEIGLPLFLIKIFDKTCFDASLGKNDVPRIVLSTHTFTMDWTKPEQSKPNEDLPPHK